MLISFKKPEMTFEDAMNAHRQGRLPEAEAVYRQLLAQNPNHADALHMLGILGFQAGQPEAGIELVQRSLLLNPNNASAQSNMAELKRTRGRLDEAEVHARQAMAIDPRMPAPQINLAMILHQKGRIEEALQIALRATQLTPPEPGAFAITGTLYADTRRPAEAVQYLEHAVRLNPKDAISWSGLGICFARLEAYDKAKISLERAVALAPENPQILLNMGAMYAHMERFRDAEPWFEKALQKDPNFITAMEHLASVKTSMKRFDEAIDLARRILTIRPTSMDTYATMAEAMMNLGRFDEAIAEMNKALAIRPYPGVYQALSNAYTRSGHPEIGLKEVEKALAIDPQNAVLHFNKSVILMLMGRLREAWQEYEWRWKHPRMVGRNRRFNVPQWEGQPLNGKRILFHAEQGLGDTIFFGRYATLVAREKGGVPVMWVQNTMVDLVKTIPGVAEVIGESGPVPMVDFHLPVMSLPRVFDTSIETIPAETPYISANPEKVEHWKKEFASRTNKFKIGLVWEGGAFQPENFLRSNSLAAYAPLADIPGVAFFGLQKGPAEVQCENPPAGMDFTNLAPYIKDFNDTAAIIDNLDLMISIDTSVVHVAGAAWQNRVDAAGVVAGPYVDVRAARYALVPAFPHLPPAGVQGLGVTHGKREDGIDQAARHAVTALYSDQARRAWIHSHPRPFSRPSSFSQPEMPRRRSPCSGR